MAVAAPSEFVLTDRTFRSVVDLVYRKAGISLHDGKRALVAARLQKRLLHGGFDSFEAYLSHVERDRSGDELVRLIDAMTTNHTSFFREPQHFDLLLDQVVRPWMDARDTSPLWGWSMPCSTGEEPVSIVVTLLEALPESHHGRVNVLASDLSTKALASARRGVYTADRVRQVRRDLLQRYFEKGMGEQDGLVRVQAHVRKHITYQHANLLEVGDIGRRFHYIFCRNVMIYFDKPVQQRVVSMLERHLLPGGYLFIGHSESLSGITHGLQTVAPATFRSRA